MCLYKIAQLKLILPHIRSKKYIFMSSIAAMLDPENRSFNEYGQQKHLIEAILLENVHQCIIIRPTYVLSSPGIPSHHPRDSYFLNCLYNNVPIQLQGDGSAELSFIFAKDVVSVLIDSICARHNDKELNLASEPISVVDLIGLFEKHAGRKAKLIFDSTRGPFDNKRYVFPESTPLICLTKLDDGIKELIKCFEIEGNN